MTASIAARSFRRPCSRSSRTPTARAIAGLATWASTIKHTDGNIMPILECGGLLF